MEFTEEQQKYIDKLIGTARQEGREQGIQKTEEKLSSELTNYKELAEERETKLMSAQEKLESYEAKTKDAYDALDGILKAKVETIGEDVAKALEELPLNTLEKIRWLENNQSVFNKKDEPGTPKSSKKTTRKTEPRRPRKINF